MTVFLNPCCCNQPNSFVPHWFCFDVVSRHLAADLVARSKTTSLSKRLGLSSPLIFASSLVEDILLAVDGQNSILQSALPIVAVSKWNKITQTHAGVDTGTHHLFLTR